MINVWRGGWATWWPHNIVYNAKRFGRAIKWSWQRICHGYCERDVWEFNNYLAEVMANGLRTLANTTTSYPGDETEYGSSMENWQDYLIDTAKMIEIGNNKYFDNPWADSASVVERRDKYEEYVLQQQEERNNYLHEGIDRLNSRFADLWG